MACCLLPFVGSICDTISGGELAATPHQSQMHRSLPCNFGEHSIGDVALLIEFSCVLPSLNEGLSAADHKLHGTIWMN